MARENIICGKTVIREVLKSKNEIDTIYVSGKVKEESIKDILDICKLRGVVIKNLHSSNIDTMCETTAHQGVAARLSIYKYYKFEEILENLNKEKNPCVLILDEIQDPQNLGAILRSAEVIGIKNIIIPQKRSVSITDTVWKTSMGALAHLNVCRVNNLANVVKLLKENEFKIVASVLDADENISDVGFDFKTAIIIGNEHTGIKEGLLKECDIKLRIPTVGKIASLNASVAAAIIMYEIKNKQRR